MFASQLCFEFHLPTTGCISLEHRGPILHFILCQFPPPHKYLGWGVSFLGLPPLPPPVPRETDPVLSLPCGGGEAKVQRIEKQGEEFQNVVLGGHLKGSPIFPNRKGWCPSLAPNGRRLAKKLTKRWVPLPPTPYS